MKQFSSLGAHYFRLGKQSCIYPFPNLEGLLKSIREEINPTVLHIDNTNPINVVRDKEKNYSKTKALVQYCTPGNIGAFGIESFDQKVIEDNNLNILTPETAYEAITILNKYGGARGENGMPSFLPGINILFGLKGETKKTHEINMEWLTKIYSEGMMIRRINIRIAVPYEGTKFLEDVGTKVVHKNRRWYYRWRDDIRHKIDFPMLQRLVPTGTILRNVYPEIYDGKTTFCRQIGTYPLIVGVKQRIPLRQFVSLRIKSHMLRSVVGEVCPP